MSRLDPVVDDARPRHLRNSRGKFVRSVSPIAEAQPRAAQPFATKMATATAHMINTFGLSRTERDQPPRRGTTFVSG
jgi:hypothetical protein